MQVAGLWRRKASLQITIRPKMTYLSTENLSKNYGLKILFEGITFGIARGDKTALVAPNGTGKSTLLKILAGKEDPDDGKVMVRNGVRLGFLEQEPRLDDRLTINEYIEQGDSEKIRIVRQYEKAVHDQAEDFNPQTQKAFEKAAAAMDTADAWDYEQRMEQILSKLNIQNLNQPISELSGGERKRVALAFVLLDEPDMLILDEPTNHLDVEMIEWLEEYLSQANTTLLMVTHDRYFLDRICNHIIEMDDGKLYHHKGNYSWFLKKRAEREEIEQKESAKAAQLLKKELAWINTQPKARGTKAKARVNAVDDIKERATQSNGGAELKLDINMKRMGSKIVELKNVSKTYDDLVILNDFNYSFKKGERIGIFGKNGVGKSTFIKILTGEEPVDSGEVITGETIKFGHYRQQGIQIDDSQKAIDVIKEIAEVITLADGNRITASQFLEHFMFPAKMQYTPVGKLSGGERRRLGLMMTLISNPNFLVLDEPTNDLDLFTLNRLEEFLLNFGGCLIIISHDRFFMDKLVDHYFVFEGEGTIVDHIGTYREYREKQEAEKIRRQTERKQSEAKRKSDQKAQKPSRPQSKSNLTYREREEYKNLEAEIDRLENEKAGLESELNSSELNADELADKSGRYGAIEQEIEEKTLRWIELAEKEAGS